jgi:4-hydroxy-tetrahydrodipicolinate reductase
MIKVVVTGIAGRMASHIAQIIRNTKGMQLDGATEAPGSFAVDTLLPEGHPVVDDLAKCIDRADVVIDFTSPEGALNHAKIAAEKNKAIVVGTTGFSEEQKSKLSSLLQKIPSVWAPNMSVGVNVLLNLVETAAKHLGHDYDVEVIEAHHRQKKDAPSGTAMALGEAVALALKLNFKKVACYRREGQTGERPKDQIGMQTIRAGDIVGDHTVMFAGTGERLELTHRATSRDNFARGAVLAAQWVVGKKPGIYSMKDVLGLK